MATKLGATIESALTVSVTHVVASGFGSAKYAVSDAPLSMARNGLVWRKR
jgi:hypothetical protein